MGTNVFFEENCDCGAIAPQAIDGYQSYN